MFGEIHQSKGAICQHVMTINYGKSKREGYPMSEEPT